MDNLADELEFLSNKIDRANDELSYLKEKFDTMKVEVENLKLKNNVSSLTEANLNFSSTFLNDEFYNLIAVDCCIKTFEGIKKSCLAIYTKSNSIYNACFPLNNFPVTKPTLILELFSILMAIKICLGKMNNLCIITDSQEAFVLIRLALNENDAGTYDIKDTILLNHIGCPTITKIVILIRDKIALYNKCKLFLFKKRDTNDPKIAEIMLGAHNLANKGITDADFNFDNTDLDSQDTISDFDSESDEIDEGDNRIDPNITALCDDKNISKQPKQLPNSSPNSDNDDVSCPVLTQQLLTKRIPLDHIDSSEEFLNKIRNALLSKSNNA